MGDGDAGIFLTGFWLIPLLLLATLAGVYLFVRHWSQRSQEELRGLGAELRRLEDRFRGLLRATGAHSAEDLEPYGARAAALQGQLDALEEEIRDLQRQRIALQEQTRRLTLKRWQVLFSAPYDWFQLRKEIAAGRQALAGIEDALEIIHVDEQSLQRIPWEVAHQARATRQMQARAKGLYDQLHARGVHGDTMQAAQREMMEVQAVLARIPTYFFTGDEAQVLEQADKQRTAEVYSLIERARPELERLLSQAEAWNQDYSQVRDQLERMQAAIEAAAEALKDVPAGVQAAPSIERFEGMRTIARTLTETLGRLEVENMTLVAEQGERLVESASAMEADFKRAREQLSALESVLNELTAGLKSLSLQVASLGARTDHPVVWKGSVEKLAALNRELNAIGPATRPREPEELKHDLTRAARLNAQYRELARHCQQVEEAHDEWLGLLAGPELSRVDAWLQESRALIDQVGVYAPENWPRSDAVTELPGELQALFAEVKRLLPAKREIPIGENELLGRLDETRQLVEHLQRLQKRVENVGQRLSNLQETERLAVQNLQSARVAFNQMQYVISSNTFLEEIAAVEAERMDGEALALLKGLQGVERGVVEKVARRVNDLLAKMESSSNRWLDQLTQDLHELVDSLSAALTALDAIANLDEPALADARRLLSASSKFNLGERMPKARFRLEELAPELKRRSDYWQSCSGVSGALAEVEEYVMSSYEEASSYRKQAQDLFEEASAWLRQTSDWPPTSISLDEQAKELQRLDEQWKGLKARRLRALALVQQLGNFSARYQTLAGKVSLETERADQEQAQVEELQVELNELAQVWENHRYTYRDNPEVSQDIRNLLEDVDHELANVRRQYKQKTKNYKQVLRALKDLNNKVKYYQVALDENNALDASGRVIRRR